MNVVQIGNWRLSDKIGSGSFGIVRRGVHVKDGRRAAVKVIDLREFPSSIRSALQREISVHCSLVHPNITEVYEVLECEYFIFIVMELLEGGDLFRHMIAQQAPLKESEVQLLFYQIFLSIHYCHERGIAHRDLKLENFLLDKERKVVKVTDFGLCQKFTKDQMLSTSCGSPSYAAPEVLQGRKYDARLADVWSLGITLFGMLTNRMPFHDERGRIVVSRALAGVSSSVPEFVSAKAKELLEAMLEGDPTMRANTDELLQFEWLQQAKTQYDRFIKETSKEAKPSKRIQSCHENTTSRISSSFNGVGTSPSPPMTKSSNPAAADVRSYRANSMPLLMPKKSPSPRPSSGEDGAVTLRAATSPPATRSRESASPKASPRRAHKPLWKLVFGVLNSKGKALKQKGSAEDEALDF
eukprot:TRINITY_DN15425_c0_g1_i1.p1 TRINITY_DN15425_c0_g1~~TRINITY_DN15425_c0_g1_i1.p1  ORF type:complete len:412 (-),score=63.02 TRINITY_DN15425_c0_g1_i1:462-1697(-)